MASKFRSERRLRRLKSLCRSFGRWSHVWQRPKRRGVYSRVSPFLEELEALALPNVLFSAVPGSVDVPSDVGFVCHGDADTCQTVAFKSGAEINSRSLDSSRAPIQEDASPTSEIRMNSFRRDATEG